MTDKNDRKTALVALGGNFLLKSNEKGTVEEQEANAREVTGRLMEIVTNGYNLIITHGNGPQVGNLLMQNEHSATIVPPMPMDVLVAQTEGSIGYVLQQEMLNHLRHNKIRKWVVTMITEVMVHKWDPAFNNPTKPVGPFFTKEEADSIVKRSDGKIKMVWDSGRGYRRIVASPEPMKIVQRHMIRLLAESGYIVIALGGGGIPMAKDENNNYVGMEAVIDKDKASALLASQVNADLFILLTAVEQVYLNFGKPDQRALDVITASEAAKYLEEGHFPPGSMGPKIECALSYLSKGGSEVLITEPSVLSEALKGKKGTRIVKEEMK